MSEYDYGSQGQGYNIVDGVFGKIYESSYWGVGVCENTIDWGSSYKSISNCADASFNYSADSYPTNGSNPTPTITGDAGGTFTATPSGLSINSSTGEITLSTSSINSYTVKYELSNGTFTEQTIGITAASFANVNSFSFDGVDEYFETPPTSFLNGLTNASWSFWIKPTDNASIRVIMHTQRDGATNKNSQFFFWMWKGNRLDFSISIASYYIRGDISYINYGQWNHLCVTFDGTGSTPYTGNMYINGVDRTTSTNLFSILPTARTDYNTRIGEIQEAGGFSFYNPFLGNMDEVAIWNSTLSSDAVREIYNSGAPNDLDNLTNASSPTAWFRMGD